MLSPTTDDRDAARAAVLPLDCSLEDLNKLFTRTGSESDEEFAKRLDEYGVHALKSGSIEPRDPVGVTSISEIATFATLAALRIEFADPLQSTRYLKNFPEHSSERRMMRYPLRHHPGLSIFVRDILNHYISNVLYAFRNLLSERLQKEVVAVLCAPDPEWRQSKPTSPARTYIESQNSKSSHRGKYADRIKIRQDGFEVPLTYATARCLVEPPTDQIHFPEGEELHYLRNRRDSLLIPGDVIYTKLVEYAWHGWYRLVHSVYNSISQEHIDRLIDSTPRISTEIKEHLDYRRPYRSFIPYYGATTSNPLRKPGTRDPISRPDKRLITIADTIRWSDTLAFGEHIRTSDLFNEVCRFYPSPDRPSNDLSSLGSLESALEQSQDDRITVGGDREKAYCTVPKPIPTPFFTTFSNLPWDTYRHLLADQTRYDLKASEKISPFLPSQKRPSTTKQYTGDWNHSEQQAVSSTYKFSTVHAVEPLSNIHNFQSLTADEVLLLTRIGLGMERQIRSYSLLNSMKSFEKRENGEPLDVDLNKLEERGLLIRHYQEGDLRQKYYSVPWTVRDQLSIPNISHDGWGERGTSERTIHRLGIDLLASLFALRPDVDKVVRYSDVWRLQTSFCWEEIRQLKDNRMDVVGFSQGVPKCVGEVETMSGDAAGTKSTVEKLSQFPSELDRYLVTPNGTHLSTLMARLSDSEYFGEKFNDSIKGNYRPSKVRNKLDSYGILGREFDYLLTYDNIRGELPNSPTSTIDLNEIVGTI